MEKKNCTHYVSSKTNLRIIIKLLQCTTYFKHFSIQQLQYQNAMKIIINSKTIAPYNSYKKTFSQLQQIYIYIYNPSYALHEFDVFHLVLNTSEKKIMTSLNFPLFKFTDFSQIT